jgi:hypothetical protein
MILLSAVQGKLPSFESLWMRLILALKVEVSV